MTRWPRLEFDFLPAVVAGLDPESRVHRLWGQTLIAWLTVTHPCELPEGPKR
jgi:hypothetical protein